MGRPNIDRGWAWVVMMTSYLGMMVYCITLYMGGVIYVALLERFGESDAKTSLVGAVSSGILGITAPVAGIIINRFSCRVAIMFGGALVTVGFGTSAVVPSLDWIIFTAGAVVGIGYSISAGGLICALGFYFEKRRDLMISIAFILVGVGMFISTPLALFTLEHLGLSGSFFVFGAMNVHLCLFGALSRPSVLEKGVYAQKKLIRNDKTGGDRTKTYFDISLLKDVPFLLYLFSTAAWNFALNVCIIHLPNYVAVIGGDNSETGQVMMAFAVANIIGRLSGALTVSHYSLKSLHVHITTMIVSGVLTSTFPFYARLPAGLYAFTVQLGVCCGWPNSMMTPISIGFVGITKLSEAYSLSYVFCGIGVTSGPVIIAYLFSVTRSYEYSFVVAGIVLLIGSATGLAALCLRKDKENSQLEINIPSTDKDTLLETRPRGDLTDYKTNDTQRHIDDVELDFNSGASLESGYSKPSVHKMEVEKICNGWEVHVDTPNVKHKHEHKTNHSYNARQTDMDMVELEYVGQSVDGSDQVLQRMELGKISNGCEVHIEQLYN